VSGGDIALTNKGKELIAADITEQKILFAEQLLKQIPLAHYIRDTLRKKANQRASEEEFIETLEAYFNPQDAERVLETMIDWGRYAEIFSYDYDSGKLSLEEEDDEDDT
jgi:NitT/TauT family transport system ATP-binding protein